MARKRKIIAAFFSRNPMIAIILGFLCIILTGALLLTLPISNRNGEWLSPLSALFTATSATCVTGLTIADTQTLFTPFGQAAILAMIQIGGLGFMSLTIILMMAFRRAISFSERILLSSSFGLSNGGGVLRFVRLVVVGSFTIEGIGALLLSFHFIPQYGFLQGLWLSIFHAISAFCNAGFDVLGQNNSMASVSNNSYVLIILMLLTIIGGLGFVVWNEILEKKNYHKLSIYSKIVLITSASLLVFGTLFYLTAEWNNPATLGNMSVGDKILNACFTSVTMRTVGFSTFDMSQLTEPSMLISCILMLIGGSSGSTAGGIKTATFMILVFTAVQAAAGRNRIKFHGREIAKNDIFRAFSLLFIALTIILTGTVVTSMVAPDIPLLNILFTNTSAFATVGVAACNIASLAALPQLLLILMMFLGRVGVLTITLGIMIHLNRNKDRISHPKANILIG